MAEGPLVHHYVKQLKNVLQGKDVEIEFRLKSLRDKNPSLKKNQVKKVEAYGKQFRIHLANGDVILIHLMMWGFWRIYKKGDTWDKPIKQARVIFRTDSHEVVVFSAPVVKLFKFSDLKNDPRWSNLGPDPLRSDFSSKLFFNRLEENPSREIGEALLDQKVIAGMGNILRNEVLFRSHIHPRRKVSSLSKSDKKELLYWTLLLFKKWMKQMGKRNDWIQIYRRSGKPCPICNALIKFFYQAGRITFACPNCQI